MAERIRKSRGRLVVTLFAPEVEVLRDLAGQLESLFEGGVPERGGDPTRDRLFPRAYLDPTEDEAETEWQSAVHGDLVRDKSAALGALVDSLDDAKVKRNETVEITLAPEVVEQWVSALNDVRLALGVVLEVTEDEQVIAPDDPRAHGFELYHWLTWLQGSLIEVLLEAEPEQAAARTARARRARAMVDAPRPGPVRTTEGYGLGDAPADGSALPWSRVEEWLTSARNYWVCTTRADGRPHAMPVWGLWLDGTVWFSTDPTSIKGRNLDARPDVVIHLESGDEVCVLEGTATRVRDLEPLQRFDDIYFEKYDVRPSAMGEAAGVYVLHPTVALVWAEADFATSATRFAF